MRLLSRFRRDQRGVSAVEFAFIAPVLILIYFSVAELSQAMLAERKVAHAASAVGDLVAQVGTITSTGQNSLADVYAAATSVIAPFPTATLQLRVTSVATDANYPNDNATVAWSNGQNMSALAKGSTVTLPANLLTASQTVIMAEAKYTYTSPLSYLFKTPIVFDQTFYLRPRMTQSVVCSDC
jgi:Flp pilus assembly protein TadG